MIQKGATAVENRQEAVKLVIEILKAQPTLLPHLNGSQLGDIITGIADSLIKYITGVDTLPKA